MHGGRRFRFIQVSAAQCALLIECDPPRRIARHDGFHLPRYVFAAALEFAAKLRRQRIAALVFLPLEGRA